MAAGRPDADTVPAPHRPVHTGPPTPGLISPLGGTSQDVSEALEGSIELSGAVRSSDEADRRSATPDRGCCDLEEIRLASDVLVLRA
jgi:hypothetical protein